MFFKYLTIVILCYGGLILFSQLVVNKLIFLPPSPPTYKDLPAIIKLKTQNNDLISAVYLPNEKAKFTILYSHGNAADLGVVIPLLQLMKEQGFSVFSYDYPGYGTSQGSSSEKTTYQSIEAAYKYLVEDLKIPPNHIILYGQSVGAAISINLAANKPVGALVSEGAFTSAFRVMTHIALLPFDKYQNLNKISRIHSPVLFIHGSKDSIIPVWHSRKLFKQANEPKKLLIIKDAGHNDLFFKGHQKIWLAIDELTALINKA